MAALQTKTLLCCIRVGGKKVFDYNMCTFPIAGGSYVIAASEDTGDCGSW